MGTEKNTGALEFERRYFAQPLEARAMDGDKGTKVGGYAAKFGSVYDLGWFTEEVAPGAFDGADMSDVVALFNHNNDLVLGRNGAGTLRLSLDETGLGYEIDLPDSPNGHNVAEAVRRGDVAQSSWGFTIADDSWGTRNGKEHRVILRVEKLYDVSPVTFPANPDTSVAKRSLELAAAPDDETEIFKSAHNRRRLQLAELAVAPR